MSIFDPDDSHPINPATGLPMVSDSTCGFDIGGNLYGCSSFDSPFDSTSLFDDHSGTSHDFGSSSFGSGLFD